MIIEKNVKRNFSEEEIRRLNEKYHGLTPQGRVIELYRDFKVSEVMLTSSFAATSALLLKLFSDVNKEQTVFFIDTGFHFKETLSYKDYLTHLYDLKVEDVRAESWKHNRSKEEQIWKDNPDLCCSINKTEPLEIIKNDYTVWVSGLMAWQSNHRSSLNIFEKRNGILKFYPLLDVSGEERTQFIREQCLPFHPLLSKGYFSIGCQQCTKPGKGRLGRWNNNPKTECGLHL